MEVGRNLLSSPPSFPQRTHLRNYLPSASASTSVLLQEQRDELKPLLRLHKDDKASQGVLNRRQTDSEPLFHEEKSLQDPNRYHDRKVIPDKVVMRCRFPSTQKKANLSSSLTMETTTTADATEESDVELSEVIALAKKALVASKAAVSLAEDTELVGADSEDVLCVSLASSLGVEDKTVRSTRLLERRSKRRKVPKSKFMFPENHRPTSNRDRVAEVRKKLAEGLDSDDPIRLFLAGPESKQLLTLAEEAEMITRVQGLMKLEQVKNRLQTEFGREPTLVEWAEAVGLSCKTLKAQIRTGTSGREKLICANLRMVVHIAKQYQGRGVGIQDLMQEGSMGLMRSVEKFRPQAGCRFATYAYWWIRQTVRKAIFQHSRTIRLPENMYTLLGKVLEAKRLYIQEGNHIPSKEELATRVGISVNKLEKLLFSTRTPVSIQQPVWADQKTTFQEITPDTGIEIPELSVTKQLMRKQVRGLLRVLNAREQQIIRLRYGIDDSNQKSLSEIGRMYGLSKERVRQLESRALYKLRQCFASQDLGAYSNLLV